MYSNLLQFHAFDNTVHITHRCTISHGGINEGVRLVDPGEFASLTSDANDTGPEQGWCCL